MNNFFTDVQVPPSSPAATPTRLSNRTSLLNHFFLSSFFFFSLSLSLTFSFGEPRAKWKWESKWANLTCTTTLLDPFQFLYIPAQPNRRIYIVTTMRQLRIIILLNTTECVNQLAWDYFNLIRDFGL